MAGVTRRLIIECGAAETRAALLAGEDVIGFWFGPARGDETLPRPAQTGDIHSGRIRSILKPLAGAFVDLGEGRDGFLPFGKGAAPVEGATVIVRVRRPALAGKGPLLSADWRKGLGEAAAAALMAQAEAMPGQGALGEPADAVVQAYVQGGVGGAPVEVIVNDGAAAAVLRAHGAARVSVEPAPFQTYAAEEALASALCREVALPGGARLIVDETAGGAVIDIDAASAADGASGRLGDKVNRAAALAIPGELARRAIGGRVVIDFLPPSDAEARGKLLETLKRAAKGVCEARFGRLSADGLFDLTAPRTRLSLLEEACEPAGGDWPVPGRRFTLDWQAKEATGALERILAARPKARARLVVGAAIGACLRERRPQWTARLMARYGARFAIEEDGGREERSYSALE